MVMAKLMLQNRITNSNLQCEKKEATPSSLFPAPTIPPSSITKIVKSIYSHLLLTSHLCFTPTIEAHSYPYFFEWHFRDVVNDAYYLITSELQKENLANRTDGDLIPLDQKGYRVLVKYKYKKSDSLPLGDDGLPMTDPKELAELGLCPGECDIEEENNDKHDIIKTLIPRKEEEFLHDKDKPFLFDAIRELIKRNETHLSSSLSVIFPELPGGFLSGGAASPELTLSNISIETSSNGVLKSVYAEINPKMNPWTNGPEWSMNIEKNKDHEGYHIRMSAIIGFGTPMLAAQLPKKVSESLSLPSDSFSLESSLTTLSKKNITLLSKAPKEAKGLPDTVSANSGNAPESLKRLLNDDSVTEPASRKAVKIKPSTITANSADLPSHLPLAPPAVVNLKK